MKKFNVILVFNKEENKILMCKREKEPYKGKFNLVGGKVEQNEEELQAAYRELKEETGIIINDPIFFETYIYSNNDASDVYFIKLKDKPLVKISKEHAQFKWVDVNDIDNYKERFAGESYLILKKFLDNKSYGFNGL